eukprot:2811704-Pyramimonas_sp.AAC.1
MKVSSSIGSNSGGSPSSGEASATGWSTWLGVLASSEGLRRGCLRSARKEAMSVEPLGKWWTG